MYISSFILSPNKDKVLVITNSNKSSFLYILDLETGVISSELTGEMIEKIEKDTGSLIGYHREDGETYSNVTGGEWLTNSRIKYRGDFSFNQMDIVKTYDIEYDLIKGIIRYSEN